MPSRSRRERETSPEMAPERLNRYLSLAASVSRRVADEMVRNGRVTVGGVPVLDPGTLWDPSTQEVRLDGRTLVPVQEEKIYIMLYKPDNVVTTMKAVSYTHLRAHETRHDLVCRLLLEKKKKITRIIKKNNNTNQTIQLQSL